MTGRSLKAVAERLRIFVCGWKAYFRLAQTSRVWQRLDEWMRHRLRAIQLKQWKHSRTIFRELTVRGGKTRCGPTGGGKRPPLVAQQRQAHQRRSHHQMGRPTRNAQTRITSIPRTARCGPACRVVWQGSDQI
ncbi:group II intron maturase-specific domain-containing protein [Rhizobium sp. 42MFCr.1]|uniref:group II intron maturase-specific domain-containing protein n=1 Tax=Rhizobium sp. 42MFCr.1 TaxID=1048680 RepID=UPI001FDA1B9F|nr:group II intron maturase-specific domain-containing protein [Rhizobium sp. 42MFCr.1]